MQGAQGSAVNSDELRKPKEDYDSECAHIASVNQLSGPVNIYAIAAVALCIYYVKRILTELKLDHAMESNTLWRETFEIVESMITPETRNTVPKKKRMQHLIFLDCIMITSHFMIKSKLDHFKFGPTGNIQHIDWDVIIQPNQQMKKTTWSLFDFMSYWPRVVVSNIFLFSPLFGEDDLLTYFSKGLKPPTRLFDFVRFSVYPQGPASQISWAWICKCRRTPTHTQIWTHRKHSKHWYIIAS